jgi:predicted Zn-dependent peptidase
LGRSILGTPENIIGFEADTIRSFFTRLYHPERIVIAAAGNLDHHRLLDRVGPVFESLQPRDGFPPRVTPEGRSTVDLTHRSLEQMHICLSCPGLSITHPQRYAYSLLNTILGGNMSSRLFQEVRERRGLAYAVYSFISSHVDTGMFGFYMGVDPKRAEETVQVVLDQIDEIVTAPADAAELSGAVEYTKGSLLLASESTDNQMVRSAQNEIHWGEDIPLQAIIAKIDAVTAGEILDLAQALFKRDRMVLTILGPVGGDPKPYEAILFQN